MKKSTVLSYLFTFCVIAFCFVTVYYFNYARMRQDQDEREHTQQMDGISDGYEDESQQAPTKAPEHLAGTEELPSEAEISQNDAAGTVGRTDMDVLEADAGGLIRTNPSMVFVVGQYDWITGIVTETVEKFPKELLGLTRQELLVYLREHPEYGTLLSFSEHAVYLRKSDEENWSDYAYYLILEEEGLMVYHLDQTTLYLDTGIHSEELNDEDRKLLEEGFYIKDTAGLFDYLQTVTS
ncbi:MAG: hypothetical protein IJZ85_07550 [Lachnospiraceae bacterium]|nr:hypothetical protein [Lachnospiraceae bacterium]